jgi:hypothetical protein
MCNHSTPIDGTENFMCIGILQAQNMENYLVATFKKTKMLFGNCQQSVKSNKVNSCICDTDSECIL